MPELTPFETALPYAIAGLLFLAAIRMPERRRPVGCLVGVFLLLLVEPCRGPDVERIAGPSTALAAFIFLGVVAAALAGAGRDTSQP